MVGGPGQYDYITMGGMFTILKVRDELPADGSEPGWYESPPGTRAQPAPAEDLKRDGLAFEAAVAEAEARTAQPVESCDPGTFVTQPGKTLQPTSRVIVAMG